MTDKKRRAAPTTLELLRSIYEDDSDAESDTESDRLTDVYELHKNKYGDSQNESSFDNELLVSKSTNSEISDLEDTETDSETSGDHQNNTTSLATSTGVTRCTKEEARRVLQTNNWRTSLHELDAFLSIVYARGAHKATKIKVHELWNKLWGIPIISETMARNRFIEIMRFLCFDYKQTRSHRLTTDKVALISTIWHSFVGYCLRHCRPGTNITVDEQLFPTKAQCRFTQYMPNKPNKFGIKFWMAANVQTKYMLQNFPYLGKDDSRPARVTSG